MNRNTWMMLIGLASIADGLVMIASLGYCNSELKLKSSLKYAKWDMIRERRHLKNDTKMDADV